MYAWLFRHLPGPTWFKVFQSLVLIAIAVFLLFEYVYPVVEGYLNRDISSVG